MEGLALEATSRGAVLQERALRVLERTEHAELLPVAHVRVAADTRRVHQGPGKALPRSRRESLLRKRLGAG